MRDTPGDIFAAVVHNNARLYGIRYVDEHVVTGRGRRLIDDHVGEQGLTAQHFGREVNATNDAIRLQVDNEYLGRAGGLVILQGTRDARIKQPQAIAGVNAQAINRGQNQIAAVEVRARCVREGPVGECLQRGWVPDLVLWHPAHSRWHAREQLRRGHKNAISRDGNARDEHIFRIIKVRIAGPHLLWKVVAQQLPLLHHLQARWLGATRQLTEQPAEDSGQQKALHGESRLNEGEKIRQSHSYKLK